MNMFKMLMLGKEEGGSIILFTVPQKINPNVEDFMKIIQKHNIQVIVSI